MGFISVDIGTQKVNVRSKGKEKVGAAAPRLEPSVRGQTGKHVAGNQIDHLLNAHI